MNGQRSWSGPRAATVAGLAVGASGIAILWASGVEFPIYPPPGIVILLAGAIFVALAPWRWAPAVGASLGLFVTVGFVASGGPPNLFGRDGTSVAIGTWIQLIGVLTALIAGVIATRINYRKQPQATTRPRRGQRSGARTPPQDDRFARCLAQLDHRAADASAHRCRLMTTEV